MPQVPDIDEAFDEYLKSHNSDRHTMRDCWKAAARWMALDILATLVDYGTACEGLPAVPTTPTQKFDEAHDNLTIYLKEIIKYKS